MRHHLFAASVSSSDAVRCKKDFKNSSLVLGLELNSDMSRDKSELYTRLGPLVVVVGPDVPG